MDHGGPSIAQVAVVSVDPCRRPSFCHGASLLRNSDCVSCVPIVFPSVGVQKQPTAAAAEKNHLTTFHPPTVAAHQNVGCRAF